MLKAIRPTTVGSNPICIEKVSAQIAFGAAAGVTNSNSQVSNIIRKPDHVRENNARILIAFKTLALTRAIPADRIICTTRCVRSASPQQQAEKPMAERIPLSEIAKLTQRSELSLQTYLQVGSFDESHADEAAPVTEVTALQALELHIASDLMRMCPARTDMVRLTKRVMREFSRPSEAYPALFAYDPASERGHIEFSNAVKAGDLSYRLTAMSHPHPGQGFAREDVGITSSGFVVLDLKEIIRRVEEAARETSEP